MAEFETESFLFTIVASCFPFPPSSGRHKKEIVNVRAARAIQVGVAEAYNGFILVLVAAAGVIGVLACIRTQLNKSERQTSSGKITSRKAEAIDGSSANKRVDKFCVILRKHPGLREEDDTCQEQKDLFHVLRFEYLISKIGK